MVHQKRCLKSEFVFEQTQSLFELSFALKFITALKAHFNAIIITMRLQISKLK